MRTKKNIIIALLAICAAAPAFADFEDLGAGARGSAMGGAYTALSDDVFGMYYNPAGLGFIRTSQLGADFGKLYFGLDDDSNLLTGFSGLALPTKKAGTFALGYRYFTLSDYYEEASYYLGYGKSVGKRLAFGVNVKYLQEQYTLDDYMKLSPVFEYGKKDSVSDISVDAGLLFNLLPNFYIGASAQDINQPNLGLSEKSFLPFTGRLGLAWKEKYLAWAFDTVYRNDEIYYNTGFERYLSGPFGIRMGLSYGGNGFFNIAGGFLLNFYRVQLDYVFQYPLSGLKDIGGTHRMSFIFRFGQKTPRELEAGTLEAYYANLQNELKKVNAELDETRMERDNLERMFIEETAERVQERKRAPVAEPEPIFREPAPVQAAPAVVETPPPPAPVVKPAPAKEKPAVRVPRKHVVQAGENLRTIARKYYGDPDRWKEIYEANKGSVISGHVTPGQEITIP